MRFAALKSTLDAAPLVMILVAIVGAPMTYFVESYMEQVKRQDALRTEIAQDFAKNWKRCDLAARFDASVPCPYREAKE